MWKRIYALMIKEFLALFKDKKSRIVIIIPPLVQLFVFTYAATYDLREVPFAVYNEDTGQAARDLIAGFRDSPTFKEVATITRDSEIATLIDRKDVLLVLRIGQQFTRDLLKNHPASVQIIIDGRNSNTASIALTYARAIVGTFNTQWAESRGLPGLPATLEVRAWYNPNFDSLWFIAPGIVGTLTLVVTLLVTALSVAREREQGTFDQLLVTPLRPFEIMIGKALPGLIIGAFEATLIILGAVLWFQIPLRGSLLTLYTGISFFLLSAVGVGLLISSLAVTQQQGLLGAFMFLVPAIILSGFATPIANMSPIVQDLTLFNPMRYFMVILRSVFIEGTPFSLLLSQFWPMAAIGAASLTLAATLFRRRMY
jgi:ABC-2 type transport system permease protein